jgi:thymidine phosphorylase
MIDEMISSGKAFNKFKDLVNLQEGNSLSLDDYSLLPTAKDKIEVKSEKSGYIANIDAYKIALGCKLLGAGRDKKSDSIDMSVGVYLNKKTGEKVEKGEILYTIYSNDNAKTIQCKALCDEAYTVQQEKPVVKPLIYQVIKYQADQHQLPF